MDSRTRELWQMVDIKGYAAMACIIDNRLRRIGRDAQNQPTSLPEYYQANRNEATRFAERIRMISLEQLGDGFPIETVTKLYEIILPTLEHLTLLVAELETNNDLELVGLRAESARECLQAIFALAKEMNESPAYSEYRRHHQLPRY